jgi:hypothetical protein
MGLGAGGIVSIGGGTGGSSGSSSGITSINGQTGPTITFKGVNGVQISVPIANCILIDGAGASGVSGGGGSQSGVIGVNGINVEQIAGEFVVDGSAVSGLITDHTLQAAYDGGDKIDVISDTGGFKGVVIAENDTAKPTTPALPTDTIATIPDNYVLAVSGHTSTPLNPNSFAFTRINPNAITIQSSGFAPALGNGLAGSIFIGFDPVATNTQHPLIQTSGALIVKSISNDHSPFNADMQFFAQNDSVRFTAGTDVTFNAGDNVDIEAGTAGEIGGQVDIRAFDGSGRLEYRFGPYQAWHAKTDQFSFGHGPDNDGYFPLPHSGQICHMILEKIGDSKFATSFAGITSGLFTHGLGTEDVIVQVYDGQTPRRQMIPDEIKVENSNEVSVLFNRPLRS